MSSVVNVNDTNIKLDMTDNLKKSENNIVPEKQPPKKKRGRPPKTNNNNNDKEKKKIAEKKVGDISSKTANNDKKKLVEKILRIKNDDLFGPIIKKKNPYYKDLTMPKLLKKSQDELDVIMHSLRCNMDRTSSGNSIEKALQIGCMAYENLLTKKGIDISGFTMSLMYKGFDEDLNPIKNDDFFYTLRQIQLEYNLFGYIRPELRLLLMVGQTTWSCYKKNKNSSKRPISSEENGVRKDNVNID
jgi:hypothetical protein